MRWWMREPLLYKWSWTRITLPHQLILNWSHILGCRPTCFLLRTTVQPQKRPILSLLSYFYFKIVTGGPGGTQERYTRGLASSPWGGRERERGRTLASQHKNLNIPGTAQFICYAYLLSEPPGFSLRLQQSQHVALAHWTLHVPDDGAVAVIHELDSDLHRHSTSSE